jgi:hypothetical protein
MVMATAGGAQPPPQGLSAQQRRQQNVLALYRAGAQTERIARLTGLSRRRVTDIVREFTIESVGNAGVHQLRTGLFADLQEAKELVQVAIFFSTELSTRERTQLINQLVKLVHEQALLIGAHAPRQLKVTNEVPPENEEAAAYARGVVRFMDLADKIAGSGYGSGRTELGSDAEELLEADVPELPIVKTELLRMYEATAQETPSGSGTLSAASLSTTAEGWSGPR